MRAPDQGRRALSHHTDDAGTLRVAHLSDLHVQGREPPSWRRLLNKRITGYANLRLRRARVHPWDVACAVLADLRLQAIDYFVVSGDLSNLALETEFERAAQLLRDQLGAPPERVILVPGNHDVYTRGAARTMRFSQYFGDFLVSDLPELCVRHSAGLFPVVRLRGPLAFIAISTAVPRPPWIASGAIGDEQRAMLLRVLEHPEVSRRTPIVVLHHAPCHPMSWRRRITNGLSDAPRLLEVLRSVPYVVVLHGHLHQRMRRLVSHAGGTIEVFGAASGSLRTADLSKMAGYNVYEFDGAGFVRSVKARLFDPRSGGCRDSSFVEAARSA